MTLVSLTRWITGHPLNSEGKVAALSRFVRWQVASRLIDQPIALPFIDHTRLLATRGMTGATGNWYCGLHEPSEMGFVLHALRPEDLFADVGANVGSYTVIAAGAIGASVLAVEPVPSTFAHLLANVRLNDLGSSVEAHCCGVSNSTGELRFTASLDTMNRVAREGEEGPLVSVPITTLDQLFGKRCPQIIKVDVEGHEAAVIDGGSQVFASTVLQAVIMETNGAGLTMGVSDEELVQRMARFGFAPHGYDPKARKLSPMTRGQANTIFARDAEALNARCALAPRRTLVNGSI